MILTPSIVCNAYVHVCACVIACVCRYMYTCNRDVDVDKYIGICHTFTRYDGSYIISTEIA